MDEKLDKLIPGEEDENVGGEPPKKRHEKKKKSKEERIRDRRSVFVLFIIVFLITLAFYLWPKIFGVGGGWEIKTPEWKSYSEVDI